MEQSIDPMTACYGLAIVVLNEAADGPEEIQLLHKKFATNGVVLLEINALSQHKAFGADSGAVDFPLLLFTTPAGKSNDNGISSNGSAKHTNKPLDVENLIPHIESLIQTQERIKRRLYAELRTAKTGIAPTPKQAVFIEEIRAFIVRELANSRLTTEQIADSLGLSPRQLSRLLKAAIGLTPARYVKFIRLEMAAQLLKNEKDKNIAEIARQVGFNDPNYFSRVFRTLYELSPNRYREEIL